MYSAANFLGTLTSQEEDSMDEQNDVPGIKTLNNPKISGAKRK